MTFRIEVLEHQSQSDQTTHQLVTQLKQQMSDIQTRLSNGSSEPSSARRSIVVRPKTSVGSRMATATAGNLRPRKKSKPVEDQQMSDSPADDAEDENQEQIKKKTPNTFHTIKKQDLLAEAKKQREEYKKQIRYLLPYSFVLVFSFFLFVVVIRDLEYMSADFWRNQFEAE